MQYPTWEEVNIPAIVPKTINTMQPSHSLDCLIHQLVFHYQKKVMPSYYCEDCGAVSSGKPNEEINYCPNCSSKRVRCINSLKFDKKVPFYSRTEIFLFEIIAKMAENFTLAFKTYTTKILDWEWHNKLYYVTFTGGDTGVGPSPKMAIIKAALLVPYLWDFSKDWINGGQINKYEQTSLLQIISNLLIAKKRNL